MTQGKIRQATKISSLKTKVDLPEAATSIPMSTLSVYPALAMASFSNSKPSRLSWMFGAKPPSSPTFVAKKIDKRFQFYFSTRA